MKRFYIILLSGLLSLNLLAQHNYDNQSVIYSNNGNVGIGTSTPNATLSISNQDYGQIALDIDNVNANLFFSDHVLSLSAKAAWNKVPYIQWITPTGNRQAYLGWQQDYFNLTLENGYNFSINGGNVGIGTTNPDAKLAVRGDIHTREVRVDLNGAVAPDFVFEPDYKLRTLAETETYIKANKHLPEIPSAAEMEQNGMELKTMNLKLLQKIEELTLYTIEQQKLIEAQQKQLQSLQKQLNKLKINRK